MLRPDAAPARRPVEPFLERGRCAASVSGWADQVEVLTDSSEDDCLATRAWTFTSVTTGRSASS